VLPEGERDLPDSRTPPEPFDADPSGGHTPGSLLRAVYGHLPNMVLFWRHGEDGFVLAGVNGAAQATTGGRIEEFVGRPAGDLEGAFPHLSADLSACLRDRAPGTREEDCALPGRTRPRRMVLTYGAVPPDTVLLHAEDVTARRQAEEQLQQSQKLEAIGRLAGGIAHDFNNLLSIIISYTDFAIEALRHSNPVRDDLLEVRKAAKRAAELTRQLLAFSRKQVLEPRVLDINEVVAGLEGMLRRLLGEDIEIVFRPAPGLGSVLADSGQIAQVLLNLAVNARDVMPAGGRLLLETANVTLDEAYAARRAAVEPGRYVLFSVSDTGCGMEPRVLERIFEPFFTTKEQGKGTGLGLSTVYGIVKQSGGNIWAYSEPGLGTTFKIYLPRVAGPASAGSLPPQPATVISGTETVLLVEDEEAMRKLAERILLRAGYLVLAAADGEEALALAGDRSDRIHLLLTDVVMPRMSGKDLAGRLVAARPGLKVLYMSGYSGEMILHHGVLETDRRFIGKPFSAPELLRKVRETIDGTASTPSGAFAVPCAEGDPGGGPDDPGA
jgi:signal transduction histidine kinase/ActR/RegA family two-component response regulator